MFFAVIYWSFPSSLNFSLCTLWAFFPCVSKNECGVLLVVFQRGHQCGLFSAEGFFLHHHCSSPHLKIELTAGSYSFLFVPINLCHTFLQNFETFTLTTKLLEVVMSSYHIRNMVCCSMHVACDTFSRITNPLVP